VTMFEKAGDSVREILARLPAGELAADAYTTRCGLPHVHDPMLEVPVGVTRLVEFALDVETLTEPDMCDGQYHWRGVSAEKRGTAIAGRCPKVIEDDIRRLVTLEERRLAAELDKIRHPFDPHRTGLVGGERALEVLRRFAWLGPSSNVLLIGPTGLGKTHLLLRSHLTLLKRGIASQYVRTFELRKIFRHANSYSAELAEEARYKLDRYVYAQAVHFDDAGHIENDQRARGEFAEGLKELLDKSRARWAIATNRSAAEAEQHPDLGGVNLSRMLADCETVELDGPDYRAQTARSERRHA
jgi:hypothetical protein